MAKTCRYCGSSNLESDPARGDIICEDCGLVSEDQILVNEVEFTKTSSGGSAAIGEFLGKDARGPRVGYITGQSSREVTIFKARKDISHLCKQLKMAEYQVELAVNFYKQVLHYNLTKGRNKVLTYAGCIYLACRIEKTPHLLIDISDITQIDVYELGRTYLKFVKALYLENSVDGAISIESEDGSNSECIKAVDPCIYVMRFAERLEFGPDKMKVVKTALRLVSRMKKDNIHTGRRPSGICGAALLIAARMHDFNRTVGDIIKVVKIHESTLRKRLLEFGDTPASALSLDDFESIDDAEEEDPPAFKAAKKAEEKLREMDIALIDGEFTDLQKEIDRYLSEQQQQSRKRSHGLMIGSACDEIEEAEEVDRFIEKSTREIAEDFIEERGLGPDISSMDLPTDFYERRVVKEGSRFEKYNNESGEIDLEGIDDEELDGYILKDADVVKKTELWTTCNAEYLEIQRQKEEQRLKDEEEGKPPKKKRAPRKKEEPANSAGEAIEKIMKQKKISKKINYDVIREMKGETVVKFGGEKVLENESVGDDEAEAEADQSQVEGEAEVQGAEEAEENFEEEYDDYEEEEEEESGFNLKKMLNGGNNDDYDEDYEGEEYY